MGKLPAVPTDGQPGPIFIFGVTRSGTTLLARMLDLHPNISIYYESNFLRVIAPDADQRLASDADVERLLDRVSGLREEGIARADVQRRFAASDRSVRALFDTILRLRMEQRDKKRYGEKTPSHFWRLSILLQWYPNARLIFLRRDPRDTYASFKHSRDHFKLGWVDRSLLGRSLYWNYYQRVLGETKQRHPESVFEVSFEGLIRDPQGTLGATCRFLGEKFDHRMLAVVENNSSFPETRSQTGLRAEVVDRRRRLSSLENVLIELLCGESMLAEGRHLPVATHWAVRSLSSLRAYSMLLGLHGLARQMRHGR